MFDLGPYSKYSAQSGQHFGLKDRNGQTTARSISWRVSICRRQIGSRCTLWMVVTIPQQIRHPQSRPETSSQPTASTKRTSTKGALSRWRATRYAVFSYIQVKGSSLLIGAFAINQYGQAFAQNGGGVYATLWDTTGISVWFFPRQYIPADLPTDTPNPAGWGLPTAFYPQTACDFSKFFTPQTVIIDTTICGNFAGQPNVFSQTCSGTCIDLVQIPENYDTAYFEISYIKLFEQCNGACKSVTTTVSVPAATSGSNTQSSAATTTSTQTGSSSGAVANAYVPIASLLAMIIIQVLCYRL